MSIQLLTTPYGPRAADTLHGVVSRAKTDDPLAPVSIVVPTNYVGVATRRMLAESRHGAVTPAGDGIVGVTLLTLYRIAEMVGAPHLAAAGRRPVSTPVIAAAIRTVLSSEPGMFADVAEHPTTEESLVRAHHELSDLDTSQLDLLAQQSDRAADVVRIHRATRATLTDDWYDEHDLMDSAVTVIGDGSAVLADLGTIAIYLPQRFSNPQAALVRALAEHAPVTMIAGCTGVERADEVVRTTCARVGLDLGGGASAEPNGTIPTPHGSRLLSASDADDEVRAAVRIVVEALRDGVPLERMAILYGSEEPYARIVHEQLEAAGIAHNGAAVRTVAESVVGHTLLGALALPDHDFRRQDVLALLASAPVRGDDGRLVPVSAWERVSRRAGVVRGVGEWRRRLDGRIEERTEELAAERVRTDRDPRVRSLEREIAHAASLRDFVQQLAAELDATQLPPTWEGKAAWAHALLRWLLGERVTANDGPTTRCAPPNGSNRHSTDSPASTASNPRPRWRCSAAPSRWSSTAASVAWAGSGRGS
ncbi:MAG: hypothetical protein M5U31_02355 [Acidimicrobiia bacterium]|nr:hypothetical protein [Acidimicrobiia bacterium]